MTTLPTAASPCRNERRRVILTAHGKNLHAEADPALLPGAGEPRPDRFSKPVRSTPGESLILPLEPSTQAPGPDWASAWEPLLYAYVVNASRQLLVRHGNGGFTRSTLSLEDHCYGAATAAAKTW